MVKKVEMKLGEKTLERLDKLSTIFGTPNIAQLIAFLVKSADVGLWRRKA